MIALKTWQNGHAGMAGTDDETNETLKEGQMPKRVQREHSIVIVHGNRKKKLTNNNHSLRVPVFSRLFVKDHPAAQCLNSSYSVVQKR